MKLNNYTLYQNKNKNTASANQTRDQTSVGHGCEKCEGKSSANRCTSETSGKKNHVVPPKGNY